MKPWMNRIASITQGVLMMATTLLAWSYCLTWLGGSSPRIGAALLTVWLLAFLAIVVHELGHYAGARLTGMTVWLINIAGVEAHAQRRGWRIRWSRIKRRGIAGYVLAFPLLDLPMRPQMLTLILGGPIANFVAAVSFGGLGWALLPRPEANLAFAFSVVSLAMSLISLVPHQGAMSSDGLKLITWLKGVSEDSPGLVHTRLISRSIAGQTANEVPENELIALEQQAAPMPLVALWYRLKSDQNRGDWTSAVMRSEQFEVLAQALDPALKTILAELLKTLEVELAFSRAILTGDGSGLADDEVRYKALWTSPWLRPRCQALHARLRGDATLSTKLLQVSERFAENSIDRALARSESLLRRYVATLGEFS